jgi:hypothetical protein
MMANQNEGAKRPRELNEQKTPRAKLALFNRKQQAEPDRHVVSPRIDSDKPPPHTCEGMPTLTILTDLPKHRREAVCSYWQTRSQQSQKQRKAGGLRQNPRSAHDLLNPNFHED